MDERIKLLFYVAFSDSGGEEGDSQSFITTVETGEQRDNSSSAAWRGEGPADKRCVFSRVVALVQPVAPHRSSN